MTTRIFRFVAVAILVAAAACGGDDGTTSDTTAAVDNTSAEVTEVTEVTETEAPATEAPATEAPATEARNTTVPDDTVVVGGEHTVQFVGCEQWALHQAFDPALADGRIPADATLVLDEDGNAGFLHLAHSCEDFVVDGESTGPAHMDVEWVSVTGPDEQLELPELEGYMVLPTAYWELVLFNTDNAVLAEKMAAIGAPALLVDEMNYRTYTDLDETGAQVGSVRSADPAVQYRWFSMVEPMPVVDMPMVFVHDVHSVGPDGTTVHQDVVCPARARIFEALGAIVVDEGGDNIGGPNEPIGSTPLWAAEETLPGIAYTSELDDTCAVTFVIG